MFLWALLTAVVAAILYCWVASGLFGWAEKLGVVFFFFFAILCDAISRWLISITICQLQVGPVVQVLLFVPLLVWIVLFLILITKKRAIDSAWYTACFCIYLLVWLVGEAMTFICFFGPQVKALLT